MRDKIEVIQIMEHFEKLTPNKILQQIAQKKLLYIGRHPQRVALTALQLYEQSTSNQNDSVRMQLLLAALGHDVGKNGINEEILGKPRTLTDEEFGNMQTHTEKTLWLLKQAFRNGRIPFIAASHHEHWDGSGYPRGLSGYDIPRLSRIITITDIWDALKYKRSYQDLSYLRTERISIIKSLHKTVCDPLLLDHFLLLVKKNIV